MLLIIDLPNAVLFCTVEWLIVFLIIFGTCHQKAIWFWSNLWYLKLFKSINSLKCMHENVHKHYEWKPKNRNNSNDHQGIRWKVRCWSAAAEALLLRPPNGKNWHIGKVSDAGKEWRWDDRGWDGWMASQPQWTWVSANSRSYWRTEKPGMLQSLVSQRAGCDFVTEQQQNIIYMRWRKRIMGIKKKE